MSDLKLLNARALRRENEIEVDLGDGTMVKARKMDMTLLVFEGLVPMPMLSAVQRMFDDPDATPTEQVEKLGDQGKPMVDLLRRHASIVTIQPKISVEDTNDPDTIPASYLNIQQLMAIWTATAVVPTFGTSQATRFRGGAVPDDAPDAPAVEVIPTGTELVVGGRLVEYIGQ